MDMRSLIDKYKSNLALLVGNGVNRYGDAKSTNSWNDLLGQMAKNHLPAKFRNVPSGVALTEFYDVLELKSTNSKSAKSLQQEFCNLMSSWKPFEHHKRIVNWAKDHNTPILTTNFERVLADAGECALQRSKKGGFTAYYPWENYYGTGSINNPSQEFGIWHVNGMERYYQSIRLGLTHYMGSVQRARGWLHRGDERRLFSGKNVEFWQGAQTWLHVIFNTPLLIFGLGLEENEVFLRWLLIERARYFKKFPERRKSAWYIHEKPIDNPGKQFFLNGVGIKTVQVAGYDEIYGSRTWN